MAALVICEICSGQGRIAPGTPCPPCGGSGMATPEAIAKYRQVLNAAAVEGAAARLRSSAGQAADRWIEAQAAAQHRITEAAARAEEAASRLELAAARWQRPDPTDPPPGVVLPAGMGGEIMYYDSLLVRQMDVWGNLNAPGVAGLPWANVISFGADPTGTLDSAPAFNAALNSLPLAGSPGKGGVLYAPAGTYRLNTGLTVSAVAPVYIKGDGTQATTLLFYGSGDAIRMYNNYVPTGGAASIKVWGGGVRDLTIDGQNSVINSFSCTLGLGSSSIAVTGTLPAVGTPLIFASGSFVAATVPVPGTVYWVLTASAGSITVGAQPGGSAVVSNISASATAYQVNSGLHLGDMKYAQVRRVNIQYFGCPPTSGANSVPVGGGIGLWQDNTLFWTEDSEFELHLLYNTIACQIDVSGAATGAAPGHDNNTYFLRQAGSQSSATPGLQSQGVVVTNGSNLYHSVLSIFGGMRSSTAAPVPQNYFLTVAGSSAAGNSVANISELWIEVESDGGAANTPALINAPGSANQINGRIGHITYSAGSTTAPPSNIGGQFQFFGPIEGGDTGLLAPFPTGVPPSGTTRTNTGPPVYMCVSGGTVTVIQLNGVTTGVTSGVFYLPPGMTYEITWSVSPTVTWISAVQQ